MTIHNKLLISSPTENTKGKSRQPVPAAHLDDDGENPVFLHVIVTFTMFMLFVLNACTLWSHPELFTNLECWHDAIIDTIVFLYSTLMIHLLLIKRRNNKQTQRELACKGITSSPSVTQLTSILMLVATGIMLVALGIAVFVFRPNWLDLGFVALSVSGSTAGMFFLLKVEEVERKKWFRAKSEDAPDQV